MSVQLVRLAGAVASGDGVGQCSQGRGDGVGTQMLLPVRSLQMPLGAISPGGAACGIQVAVAL